MTHKSVQTTGEFVQEYVRCKWERAVSPERVQETGNELDPALRSRIDVLGLDSMQLLNIAPALVMPKLEELEHHAALEDSGMFQKIQSTDATALRKVGRQPLASKGRKRALD
jgi:hypothetical protein